MQILHRLGVVLCLACATSVGAAQGYPNRTVRIVVPIAAGGATDVFGRTLAAHYAEVWGQQVIVDNRPGAGGMIGSELVAKSAPDGYNLLMAYTSHVINPSLWTRLPYDTLREFAPVTMVATVPSVLIVHPSLPVRSVTELIAFAKRRPHELDYGSSGVGTPAHLAAALFAQRAGLYLTHIPYKGGLPAMYELLGGQISIMFGSLATAIPNIRNGRIGALADQRPARGGSSRGAGEIGEVDRGDLLSPSVLFDGHRDARVLDRREELLVRPLRRKGVEEIEGDDRSFPRGRDLRREIDRGAPCVVRPVEIAVPDDEGVDGVVLIIDAEQTSVAPSEAPREFAGRVHDENDVAVAGIDHVDLILDSIGAPEVAVAENETARIARGSAERMDRRPVARIDLGDAGVFSIGDVVKAIITDQKVTIENLENYIMGKYQ